MHVVPTGNFYINFNFQKKKFTEKEFSILKENIKLYQNEIISYHGNNINDEDCSAFENQFAV